MSPALEIAANATDEALAVAALVQGGFPSGLAEETAAIMFASSQSDVIGDQESHDPRDPQG